VKSDPVLAKINGAVAYLAKAKTLQEINEVIAISEAALVWGKRVKASVETMNAASEIRLRAERKLGAVLERTPKQAGARDGKRGSKKVPRLAEFGLSKKTSSRAQLLARVPDDEFEKAISVDPERELNHNRVIKDLTEKKQREARQEKRQAAAARAPIDERIIVGDFREPTRAIPNGGISLIFTDPPYDREASKMLGALGEFANAKLADGGSLLLYVGQTQMPSALDALRQHLRYWWTVACIHAGRSTVMREYGINAGWKAVLWFVKGTRDNNSIMVNDVMSGGEEKSHHDWQQSESEAAYWIEKLCPPDGIVCDPFLGGGTTAVAAEKLKRKWIGFEIDKDTAAIAAGRLARK
jgi:DNA methylase